VSFRQIVDNSLQKEPDLTGNRDGSNFLKRSDSAWVFTTYFAEGFPFTIIRTVSAVFFRDMRVSLEAIGLTSLFGLPWVLKFLWSPQLDRYGTKRKWLIGTQFFLVAMMILVAALAPVSFGPVAIAVVLFLGAFIAATQDIAIDGYYMEALDRDGQAKYVGFRVMAYRIAMITGTGIIVTIGALSRWWLAFAAAAALFLITFLYHFFFLREVQKEEKRISELTNVLAKPRVLMITVLTVVMVVAIRQFLESGWFSAFKTSHPFLKSFGFPHIVGIVLISGLIVIGFLIGKIKTWLKNNPESYYAQTFASFADRNRFGTILAFVVLLRAGEFMLGSMISPFIVDLGFKVHYGWISGLVGLPASIVGAIIGGRMIARYDLKKVIWPFILAQNLALLGYMWLAIHMSGILSPDAVPGTYASAGNADLARLAVVHFFEQFAGGLGTSVLMTYLMRLCKPGYKAAHYAIGSGLMSLSGLFSGSASGFLAGWLGYAWAFGLSFVVSIPAMLLIPSLPLLIREK